MIWLLLAPMLVLPPMKWSTNSGLWRFDVYTGFSTNAYTNKIAVGFPRTEVSNFAATVRVPNGKNAYVVTVTDKQQNLESGYSNTMITTNGTNVSVEWWWKVPQASNSVTNVVTIASGTNSLVLTNPWSRSQVYRLKNKTLQFALDPKGPWMNYTNWPGASNRLAIRLTHP